MNKVMIAPARYVQGPGALKEAGSLMAALGKTPLLLWGPTTKSVVGETLLASLKEAGLNAVPVDFNGETTKGEAERVAKIIKEKGVDITVAVGGGKVQDTAKASAASAGTKMVTVPTIASNDSPTSSYTVWYDEEGKCTGFETWGVNPDLVLVDTEVIANAPLKTFVAGMGDALGTWVEADACSQATAPNLAGGIPTMSAMAIARLCYETIMENGVEAMKAVEAKKVNEAVEKVVEANVLMSGLGFENGGVATAHMVAMFLPPTRDHDKLMHGDEVGFGVLTQLCLDKSFDAVEKARIVDFEIAIGLPVTFADLGLEGIDREGLKVTGDVCGGEGSLCANHPFPVTSEDIVDAMIAADAFGQERKKAAGIA
ncbi:MAG: glycerol dehydrogenase [Planctomycetota bacterium]|jgi:glycerol dehydrogenase